MDDVLIGGRPTSLMAGLQQDKKKSTGSEVTKTVNLIKDDRPTSLKKSWVAWTETWAGHRGRWWCGIHAWDVDLLAANRPTSLTRPWMASSMPRREHVKVEMQMVQVDITSAGHSVASCLEPGDRQGPCCQCLLHLPALNIHSVVCPTPCCHLQRCSSALYTALLATQEGPCPCCRLQQRSPDLCRPLLDAGPTSLGCTPIWRSDTAGHEGLQPQPPRSGIRV